MYVTFFNMQENRRLIELVERSKNNIDKIHKRLRDILKQVPEDARQQ